MELTLKQRINHYQHQLELGLVSMAPISMPDPDTLTECSGCGEWEAREALILHPAPTCSDLLCRECYKLVRRLS